MTYTAFTLVAEHGSVVPVYIHDHGVEYRVPTTLLLSFSLASKDHYDMVFTACDGLYNA